MIRVRGWRPLLRLAWRDALRAKGRSILVLVMIALPVLGVVAADVLFATSDVSGAEALERRLGTADAVVVFQPGQTKVVQDIDPDRYGSSGTFRGKELGDLDDVRAVLGDDVRGIEWQRGDLRIATPKGFTYAAASLLDLRDPLAGGLWRIDAGRAAEGNGEVVLNTYLADRADVTVGDEIETADGQTYEVVGIGEDASDRSTPFLVGVDPSLVASPTLTSRTLLVDAGGPVTWDDVRSLNSIGATVLSRAVLLDPPPASEIPEVVRQFDHGVDEAVVAVAVLVVVMALIEVVLLAGPAFAVGARRQSRNLALMAATGGTPTQARRVILASGLVLGGIGAVLGVVLGLGAAATLLPVFQRFSGSWLGPFDVPWLHVAGIAVFGLVSALLAAVVPAWIASRQDVVAVLAGRRADRPAGLRSPALGLVLLLGGSALAAYGAVNADGGEILIAASAIPTVLGMVLLIPLVLAGLGRLSGRLPLALRYAVRDAARHRTRTVPAVAAVAATVAGVVALGVANASDAAQSRALYTPILAMGDGTVITQDERPGVFGQLKAAVERETPDTDIQVIDGVLTSLPDGRFRQVTVRAGDRPGPVDAWGSALGSSLIVSDAELPAALPGVDDADRAAAREVLAHGGAVVFTSREVSGDEARIKVEEYGPQGGRGKMIGRATVPAYFLKVGSEMAPAQVVLSPAAAEKAGLEVAPVALALTGGMTTDQEQDLSEAVAAVSENASVYVERGFQNDEETVILLLILGGLGAVLMLGGTLTATFLALSDARPDLATLAAVGASPRSRRGVAASYAVVVGLVGALLGAAVGFIPGIAVTYPLTGDQWGPTGASGPSHYLDVPWLLVGTLVIALPLVTALVVGLTARSRLPLVSRLT